MYGRQQVEYILWQNTEKLLRFTYNPPEAKVNPPEEIKNTNTIYHYALEHQQIILTNDYKYFCKTLGVDRNVIKANCWLGIPMKVRGKTLGMLVVWTEEPDHYFRLQDKLFLSIITQITAFALENVYLYEYISEKEKTPQSVNPTISAPLPPEAKEDMVNYLLRSVMQFPDVSYGGVFLRSQSHEKWRLVAEQSRMDKIFDPGSEILKTLIYLPEKVFSKKTISFYTQSDPTDVFNRLSSRS